MEVVFDLQSEWIILLTTGLSYNVKLLETIYDKK